MRCLDGLHGGTALPTDASALTAPDACERRTFYEDSDGDGFGVPNGAFRIECSDALVPGFSPSAADCDDDDPALHVFRSRDADGDGHGAGELVCVGATAPGFVVSAGDCDDGDPDRSPDAQEASLDGVDSNCDGLDFPIVVTPTERCGETLAPLGPVHLPARTSCGTSPDVFIAALGGCEDCGPAAQLAIILGNRADEPADAEIELTLLPGDPTPFVPIRIPIRVEASSVSPIVRHEIPSPGVAVRVRTAATNCDDAEDSAELIVGWVDC